MKTLFITGASGFVGSYLLKKIDFNKYKHVYCLSRSETKLLKDFARRENFTFIKGSIFDSDLYSSFLASSNIVIHLAAITGKARPEEYFSVNSKGTELLIKQCESAAISNFLHVSSIAVKIIDKSHYYYAQSKEQGENAVKNSRLHYTIVRPTIIIGQEAAIWKGLNNLAGKANDQYLKP